MLPGRAHRSPRAPSPRTAVSVSMAVVYPLCGFYGLAVLPAHVAAGLASVSLVVYAVVVVGVTAGCGALTAAGVVTGNW
jgi:hypothetical protein